MGFHTRYTMSLSICPTQGAKATCNDLSSYSKKSFSYSDHIFSR